MSDDIDWEQELRFRAGFRSDGDALTMLQAAAEIARLRAENAQLREALETIADWGKDGMGYMQYLARCALSKQEGEG